MAYIVRTVASLLLDVISTALVIRCILSWIPSLRNTAISNFIYSVTEPIVAPVRELLYRLFPRLETFPIDFSVLVVFLLIDLIAVIL